MRKSAAKIIAVLSLASTLSGCTMPEIFKGNEENALNAGLTALDNLEFRDALSSFSLAESQGEDGVALYRGKGIAEYNLADYEAAGQDFAMALESCNGIPDETTYDIAYYYAQTLVNLEKYDEAAAVYDAILGLRPGEDQAKYLRGLCYLNMGEHDKASEDFKAVVDAIPRNYDRIFSIYDALCRAGYKPEADGMLNDIMSVSGTTMTSYEKGRLFYYLGDREKARTSLEEALGESADKKSSEKIPIVILLGEVVQDLGDDEYAISVYRRFLQDDQSEASIYNALGVCEIRMGSYADAVSDLQIGLALDDPEQNAALLRNLIVAYENIGNYDLAAQRMSEYLELVPGDEEARRENIFLSTRLEQSGEPEVDDAEGVTDAEVSD
jgi:tetratricopeptide (TPR) repeat protein